ncbi:hypothetical protein EX30DRAFT_163919 [Ascodesmis nigricans]|uniref:Uncharacterized protein n=1 Tax=Ascodesmis nigricans TaxID=341454 RepID=A0A4S2MRX6_9PEZI|nr:hypothetical protein EX30DRAFT_163919 [Ascodesmis nigricans]
MIPTTPSMIYVDGPSAVIPLLNAPTQSESENKSNFFQRVVDNVEPKPLDTVDIQTLKLVDSEIGHDTPTVVEPTATNSHLEDDRDDSKKADTPQSIEIERSNASQSGVDGLEFATLDTSDNLGDENIRFVENDAACDDSTDIQPTLSRSEDGDDSTQTDAPLSTERKSDDASTSGVDDVELQPLDSGDTAGEADTGHDVHTDVEPVISELKEKEDNSTNENTEHDTTNTALSDGEVEELNEDVSAVVDDDVSNSPTDKVGLVTDYSGAFECVTDENNWSNNDETAIVISIDTTGPLNPKNTQAQTPNFALGDVAPGENAVAQKGNVIPESQTKDLRFAGPDTIVNAVSDMDTVAVSTELREDVQPLDETRDRDTPLNGNDEVKQKHQTPPTDVSGLDRNDSTTHIKAESFGQDTQSEQTVPVDNVSSGLMDDTQAQVGRDSADVITDSDVLGNSNGDGTTLATQLANERSDLSMDDDQDHAREDTKEALTGFDLGNNNCGDTVLNNIIETVKFPTPSTADGEIGASMEDSALLSFPATSTDVEYNSSNTADFENVEPSAQGLDGASTNDIGSSLEDAASPPPYSPSPAIVSDSSSLETAELAIQGLDGASTHNSAGTSPEDPASLLFSSTSPDIVANTHGLTTLESVQVAEKYLDGISTKNNIGSSSEDASSLPTSSIPPAIVDNLPSPTPAEAAQFAEQDLDGTSTNNSPSPSSNPPAIVSNSPSLTVSGIPELTSLGRDDTPTDANPSRNSLSHGRGDTTLNVPAGELASAVLNVAQGLLGRGFNRITGAQGSSNDVFKKDGEGQKLEVRPVEPTATCAREDTDLQQSSTFPQSEPSTLLFGGNSLVCADNISSSENNSPALSASSTANDVAYQSAVESATPLSHQRKFTIPPFSSFTNQSHPSATSPPSTGHNESVNATFDTFISEFTGSSLPRPPQAAPKFFSSGFGKLNTGSLSSFIPTGVDRLWKAGNSTPYVPAGGVPSGADVVPASALDTATDNLDTARQPSRSVQGLPIGLEAPQSDPEARSQGRSDRVSEGHGGDESTSSTTMSAAKDNELESELEPAINNGRPRTGEFTDEAAGSTGVQKTVAGNGSGRIPFMGLPTVGLPSVAMPSIALPTVELAVKFPSFGLASRGKKPVAKPLVEQPSAGLPSMGLPSVKFPSLGHPSTPKTSVEKPIAAPAVENTSTGAPIGVVLVSPNSEKKEPMLAKSWGTLTSVNLPSTGLPSVGVPSAASPSVNLPSFRQSSTANTVETPIPASSAEPASSGSLIDAPSGSSNAEKKESMLTTTWDTLTSAKFPSVGLPFVGVPFVASPPVKFPSFGRPSTPKSPVETKSVMDSALQRGSSGIISNTPSGSPSSEKKASLFTKSWDNRSWSRLPSVGPPSPSVELPSFGTSTRRHASGPFIGRSNIRSSPTVIIDEPSCGGSIPCVDTTIPTMQDEKDTSRPMPDVQGVKVQDDSKPQKLTAVSSDNDSQATPNLLNADENKSHTQTVDSVPNSRDTTAMEDISDQDAQPGSTLSTVGDIPHHLAQALIGDINESNLQTKMIEQLYQLRDGIIASNAMLAHTALYSTTTLHEDNASSSKSPATNLPVFSSTSKGLDKGVTDQMLGIDLKKPSLFNDPVEGVRAIQRLNQMIAENSKALKSMDSFSSSWGSSKATTSGSKDKEELRETSVGEQGDTAALQVVVAPEDATRGKMKNTEPAMNENLEVKKGKLPCGLSPVIEQGETDASEDGGEKILKQKARATPLSTSAALDTGFTPKQRSSSDAPRNEPRSVFDIDLLPDDFLPPYFDGSRHCTEPGSMGPDKDFHDLITPVDATRLPLHDEDARQFTDFDYQGNLFEGSLASFHGSEAEEIEQDWTMVPTSQFHKRAPSTYTTYTAYTMAELCDDHRGECSHHSPSRQSTSYSAKPTLPDTKWPSTCSEIPFGGEASTLPSTSPTTPPLPSSTLMGISSSNTGVFTPPDSPEMKRLLGDTITTDTTDPYTFTRPRSSDSITLIEAAPLDVCPHCDAPHCDASSMDHPNALTISNELADVLAVFEVMGLTLQVTVAGNAEHLSPEEIAATKETLKKRIQQVAEVTNAGYRIKKKATWTRGKGDAQKEKEKEKEKGKEREVSVDSAGKSAAQNPEGSPKGFRLFGYGR